MNKWKCEACNWTGAEEDLEIGDFTTDTGSRVRSVCPECHSEDVDEQEEATIPKVNLETETVTVKAEVFELRTRLDLFKDWTFSKGENIRHVHPLVILRTSVAYLLGEEGKDKTEAICDFIDEYIEATKNKEVTIKVSDFATLDQSTDIYTCPSCDSSILSTPEMEVGYCSTCGAEIYWEDDTDKKEEEDK